MWDAERKIDQLYRARRKRRKRPRDVADCVICLQSLSGGTFTLECGHRFHRRCLKQWCQTNASCPTCRQELDVNQRYSLVFRITDSNPLLQLSYSCDEPATGSLLELGHVNDIIATVIKQLLFEQYRELDIDEDDSLIHPNSRADELAYTFLLSVAQEVFSVQDWSDAFVGWEGDNRPPFIVDHQVIDDVLEEEAIVISQNALLHWHNHLQ